MGRCVVCGESGWPTISAYWQFIITCYEQMCQHERTLEKISNVNNLLFVEVILFSRDLATIFWQNLSFLCLIALYQNILVTKQIIYMV